MHKPNIISHISQRQKTHPLNQKLISQYVFPINQSFSFNNNKTKYKKEYQKNIFSTINQSFQEQFDNVLTNQSEKLTNFNTDRTVSQNLNANLNNTPRESINNRTVYGLYPQRLLNKNTNLYKKRLNSLDVTNINQLNITSFNFRTIKSKSTTISHSVKNSKKNTFKELIIKNSPQKSNNFLTVFDANGYLISSEYSANKIKNNNRLLQQSKFSSDNNQQTLKNKQNHSTPPHNQQKSNVLRKKLQTRINWKCSLLAQVENLKSFQNNKDILCINKDYKYEEQDGIRSKTQRKNSISPWENQNNDQM